MNKWFNTPKHKMITEEESKDVAMKIYHEIVDEQIQIKSSPNGRLRIKVVFSNGISMPLKVTDEEFQDILNLCRYKAIVVTPSGQRAFVTQVELDD